MTAPQSRSSGTDALRLLACPFCGGGAHVTKEDGRVFAACDTCFCAVGEAYDGSAMPAHCFYEEAAAAEAWNTRTVAQAQPQRDELAKKAQYVAEGIILRRLHEKRIEGYTIDTAKEIAQALEPIFIQGAGDRGEVALALLRWGTWDMTPAAHQDWKKRAEDFLSSVSSTGGGPAT